MTSVIAFPSRGPVVVHNAPLIRPQMSYDELRTIMNRNLFTAERGDAAAAATAIQTLRHIEEFALYPQARALAAKYLRGLSTGGEPVEAREMVPQNLGRV